MNRNNYQILPFYNSLDEQERNRSYISGDYMLIGDVRRLIPFQVIVDDDTAVVVKLCNSTGCVDITSRLYAAGLKISVSDGVYYLIWGEMLITQLNITEGVYWLQITQSGKDYYSERIRLVNNPFEKYIRVQFWQADNFIAAGQKIVYDGTYASAVYIDAEIGKPDYPFEEVVTKRDGYEFVEKQISEKIYRFTFLAPEYLCDALRVVRMHDYVRIAYKFWEWDVDKILFTPKWLDEGDLAQMDVEFHTDTIVKKTGKIIAPSADFNEDFNEDFNT